MARLRYNLLILFAGVCCMSCGSKNYVFEQNVAINAGLWDKNKIVSITIPVDDTVQYYDLEIYLRNRNDYPYSNIYLFITVTAPTGAMVTDTMHYILSDVHGKWTGKGFSQLWDNRFLFRKNVRFAGTGNYLFQIRQGMRENELPGITDVGIRMVNSQ